MRKRLGRKKGHVLVTFEVDEAVGAEKVHLCGEFNHWSRSTHLMDKAKDGGWQLDLELPAGTTYRFRYLLDDERWENDWAADDYVPNDFGGDDSVVDLTSLDGEPLSPPPAPRKRAAKKKDSEKADKA